MKVARLAAIVVLLALGTAQADQTNLLQNVHLRLSGLKQGDTSTNRNLIVTSVDVVRIDTRKVIQALGAATANAFTPASRLVLVTPLNGNAPSVQVRDGDVHVDVTAFFELTQTGPTPTSLVINLRNNSSIQTTYSIRRVMLKDVDGYAALAGHFDITGLATETTSSLGRGPGNGLMLDAAGLGDWNGEPLVIQGSINVLGNSLEVVPENPGGGGNT